MVQPSRWVQPAADILGLLLPALCPACGRPIRPDGARPVCGTCEAAATRRLLPAEPIPGWGRPLLPTFEYAFPLDRLILVLKRDWSRRLAALLVDRVIEQIASAGLLSYPQVVVPVPLHPARRRARGHDQSVLLARILARGLGIPAAGRALRRRSATPPQRGQPREVRLRSMRGAFCTGRQGPGVRGLRALLLDDVVTTGATMYEAAAALEACEPAGILCVALAGTPLRWGKGELDRPGGPA